MQYALVSSSVITVFLAIHIDAFGHVHLRFDIGYTFYSSGIIARYEKVVIRPFVQKIPRLRN